SDSGRTNAFVAWWASYPAEKVEGYQVSNLVVFETLRPRSTGAAVPAGLTYPPGYFDQILPSMQTAADLSYDEITPVLHIGRAEDSRKYRDAVTGSYVRQDDLIGRILRAAGPGTTVMVVSDHGFKTGSDRPADVLPFTTQQPVEWHRENGIFILSGP